MKLLFIDTETTGLDSGKDEIIDIAMALWVDGLVAETYSTKFKPHGPVSAEAAKVNGYSVEGWVTAPFLTAGILEAHISPLIVKATEGAAGAVLAGSNPGFDRRFLDAAYAKCRVTPPRMSHKAIDTAILALPFQVAGAVNGTSLNTLSKFFGFGEQKHTAADDVAKTVQVFDKLMNGYLVMMGVRGAA